MNSVADIWKIVLSRLSQDLSETTISTWFDEVEAVSIKDRTLYLHCPNDFKRSTIESMFSDRIKDSLRDIYSADFDVKLLSTAESTALFEPEVKNPPRCSIPANSRSTRSSSANRTRWPMPPREPWPTAWGTTTRYLSTATPALAKRT